MRIEIPIENGVFFVDLIPVLAIILAIIVCVRMLKSPKKDADGKTAAAPKPAPAAKPKSASKPAPAPKAAPKAAPAAKPKPAPAAKPKPAPVAKPKPAPVAKPKPAPKPQAASAPQAGLFESAKSFMKERKENAENEADIVLNSPMTQYVRDAFVNALQELRPQLAASATHKDYFEITVYKDYCRLNYNAYDLRENRYKSTQVITQVQFKTIQNLFRWENGYEQISSRKAKSELKDFLVHECIRKTEFLIRVQCDWMGLLISQM